jgi:2-polyprenyl-6-methoxyphenol hydroxylase-like FAD-dependent oxidoreductase
MSEHVRCVVVGGGPAGMMLGLLLARQGVEVAVLEKHQDFCATSAATPSIPRPWNWFTNWGGSRSSSGYHTRRCTTSR